MHLLLVVVVARRDDQLGLLLSEDLRHVVVAVAVTREAVDLVLLLVRQTTGRLKHQREESAGLNE